MKKRFLFLVLSSLISHPAKAFEPFQVKDIRVEGIQRTEAGTVFSYLPIKIGDDGSITVAGDFSGPIGVA